MYELAQVPVGATLSVRDLCGAADVPENFGASIVTFLVAAGLVRPEGYNKNLLSMAKPAEDISMAQIIRACEPEFSLSQCTREPDACSRAGYCGAHRMWVELDAMVWQRLESITLAQVAAGMPSGPRPTGVSPALNGLLGGA